jgi:predicted Zn-dependent protease
MTITEEVDERLQNRQTQEALEIIQNYLKKYPEDKQVLFKHYEVLLSLNRLPHARNVLNKMVKLFPDDREIRSRLLMLTDIMRFEEKDIYASTNLNNDPWLD